MKNNIALILIILLSIALRFFSVAHYPPSLNWDEISHGYNAYSLLNYRMDEWGEKLPTIFRAYGDYKLPLYIYLTSISIFLFGLTDFAVRLPSVLAGVGIVFFTYKLVQELKIGHGSVQSKWRLEILSALLVAVEPWTFFISRPAFEANLALFFFVSGLYFFLKAVNRSGFYIPYSALMFSLTVWTYNSYRVFTPLFLVGLIFIYWRKIKEIYANNKRVIYSSVFIVFLFFTPMFYQLFTQTGTARYSKVAILDEGAIAKIESLRQKYPRYLVNKVTYFLSEFGKNYISYFDPRYLFLKGGTQYQFSVQGHGLLYLVNLPPFYYGIYSLIKNRKDKVNKLLIFWLLLSPVAGSLTREAPHVLRSVTMLPLPMILVGMGLIELSKYMKIIFIYILILVFLIFRYLYSYFIYYPVSYSPSWQYGYKEVAKFIETNNDNYAKIIMTKKYGEPHEFLLFYLKFDPKRYMNDQNLNRFNQSNWWWIDGFDKFYFVNDWQIPKEGYKFVQESKKTVDCRQAKCLLITSPNNAPSNWKKIQTINFLNGLPAFELYENN